MLYKTWAGFAGVLQGLWAAEASKWRRGPAVGAKLSRVALGGNVRGGKYLVRRGRCLLRQGAMLSRFAEGGRD